MIRLSGRWPHVIAVLAGLGLLGSLIFMAWVVNSQAEPSRGEPVVTTTYYAEPSGRQCSRTLAQTSTDVSVAVSCSYPPAESRIRDLLEGAGQ